jgi:hypothetical protein
MGLEVKEQPEVMRLGSTFHYYMERYYNGLDFSDIFEWASKNDSVKIKDSELSQHELLMYGLLLAYQEICHHQEYKGIEYQVNGTPEVYWEYPDSDRLVTFCGTVDLLNKNQNYFVEFKYTASPEGYNFFTMRNQLSQYFLGTGVDKAIVRCIRRPSGTRNKDMLCGELIEKVRLDVLRKPKHYIHDTVYFHEEFKHIIKNEVMPRTMIIAEEIRQRLNSKNPLEQFFQEITSRCNDCQYKPICVTNGVPENLYIMKGDSK